MSNLADNIEALLKERGWNQSQLADESDVDTATISRVMNGKTDLVSDSLIKLAAALQVSPGKLLSESRTPIRTTEVGRRRIKVWDYTTAARFVYSSPKGAESTPAIAENQAYLLTDKKYPDEVFGLLVSDGSMEPLYPVGMSAFIDPTRAPKPNKVVAIGYSDAGQDYVVLRQFHDRGPGDKGARAFEAVALNPAYRSFKSSDPSVKLIGVMVERRYYEEE